MKIPRYQVFENFILADEPFAKALQILEICVSVNIKLCGKLASSLLSTTTFNESFKVTWVPIFILDLNLLSCEIATILHLKIMFSQLIPKLYYSKRKLQESHSSLWEV